MVYHDPVKTITQKIAGYSRPKEYYAPKYETNNDYFIRDHRNTLHWEPDIALNDDGEAEISFFTSDDEDEYLIHCEGRSDNGTIGISHLTFRTK
jgi:S-adenosylhomocysteine hydrolase